MTRANRIPRGRRPGVEPDLPVEVRYPLALKSFDVALKPPAYTGVAPSTVKGGDLRVIEGTDATFQITFDSPPAEASLVVTDPSVRSKKDKTAPSRVIPLKSERRDVHGRAQPDQGPGLSDRGQDGRRPSLAQELVQDRRPRRSTRRAWLSSSPTRHSRSIRSPRS